MQKLKTNNNKIFSLTRQSFVCVFTNKNMGLKLVELIDNVRILLK